MKAIAIIALIATIVLSIKTPNTEGLLGCCWIGTSFLVWFQNRQRERYPGPVTYLCFFIGIMYFIILTLKLEI